ncbi:helix-turn-helix transcriptional regulator [Pullulanibacillus sp. KACC 23026]|uniref:helix-turn-helix transcriptional regulator n=1 Tax=Pullulanibacillus sp. KACC 23026 TaxID=3028315 RepID=UPI0023B03B17|nr:helix-turn-helix transcriptional regulator [Pullulanibacillus sp. KACC 23026]WEG14879.1 helix-turn-helix transcriptional regulator [Pullulanibacillus sp. KACC 23026]
MNLTQQQLAEKIGVTRQTISLIEKGTYNPSLKLCLEICYAVNKTLDELFWIERERG